MLSNSFAGIMLKIYLGLCFIIDVFSFVLYILMLFFIGGRIKKKDKFYSSGFYKLIIFNGILNLIFIVEEYTTFRIPQAGFFEHFYVNIFSKYLISGMCYTYSMAQGIFISLSGITITLNRYIAIKYPTKYNYFWSGWRLILLCTWPVFISIFFFINFYKAEVEYALTCYGSITVHYKNLYISNVIYQIAIYIHTIALCINILLNCILVYTIKHSNILQMINNNIKKREMKLEVTMAKFAVIYCTIFAIVVCTEIGRVITITNKVFNVAEHLLTFFVLLETVMVFLTPYTLLYLNYDFRQKFFIFIRCYKLWFLGNKNKILVTEIKILKNVLK